MSGKMTAEQVKERLGWLRENEFPETATAIEAHIAALTAEREQLDHMTKALDEVCPGSANRGLTPSGRVRWMHAVHANELDDMRKDNYALRERVRGLEAENAELQRECNRHVSHLAAMRQRAENIQRPGVAASVAGTTTGAAQDVARYIIGDDATAQKETKAERLLREEREASAEMVHKAAESTTSEAFATLVKATQHGRLCESRVSGGACDCGSAPLLSALSLLERRMGAMEAAARELVEAYRAGESIVQEAMDLEEALTDAPPVSPVPAELATLIDGFAGEVRRAEEHHANKGRGGMSVSFHGDFASVSTHALKRLRWWADALKQGRTSAPVFTLEEVRKVVAALGPLSEEYAVERLAALRRTQ